MPTVASSAEAKTSSEMDQKYRMVSHLKHLLRTPPELPMAAGAPPEPGDEQSRDRLHRIREQSKSPHARTPRSPGSALLFRRSSKSAENTPRHPQKQSSLPPGTDVEICEMSPATEIEATRSPSKSVTIAAFDEKGNPIHTELGRRELALLRFKDRHRGQSNSPRGDRSEAQNSKEVSSDSLPMKEREVQRRRLAAARRARLTPRDPDPKDEPKGSSPAPVDPSIDDGKATRRRRAARARKQKPIDEGSPDLDIEICSEPVAHTDQSWIEAPQGNNHRKSEENDYCAASAETDGNSGKVNEEDRNPGNEENCNLDDVEDREKKKDLGVAQDDTKGAAQETSGEEHDDASQDTSVARSSAQETSGEEHDDASQDNSVARSSAQETSGEEHDDASQDNSVAGSKETSGEGDGHVSEDTSVARSSAQETNGEEHDDAGQVIAVEHSLKEERSPELSHPSVSSLSEEDDDEIVLMGEQEQTPSIPETKSISETMSGTPEGSKKKRHRNRKKKNPAKAAESKKDDNSTILGVHHVDLEQGNLQDKPVSRDPSQDAQLADVSNTVEVETKVNEKKNEKKKRNRRKDTKRDTTKAVSSTGEDTIRQPGALVSAATSSSQHEGYTQDPWKELGVDDRNESQDSFSRPRKPSAAPCPPERSDTPTSAQMSVVDGTQQEASDNDNTVDTSCDVKAKKWSNVKGKKKLKPIKKLSSITLTPLTRADSTVELDFSDVVDEVAFRQQLLSEHFNFLRVLAWNQAQEEKEIEVAEIRQDMLLERAEAEGVADSTLQLAEEFAEEKLRIQNRLREAARGDLERAQDLHRQDLKDVDSSHQRMMDFVERQHQRSLAAMNQSQQAEVQRLLETIAGEQRTSIVGAESASRATLLNCEIDAFQALSVAMLPMLLSLADASHEERRSVHELQKLNSQLASQTEALVSESLEHDSTKDALQKLSESKFELQSKLNACEAELQTKTESVTALEDKITVLEEQICSGVSQTTELQEQLDQVRVALAENSGMNEDLQAQLVEANGVSAALKEQLEDLERDSDVATHQLKQTHKQQLEAKDFHLQGVLATIKQEVIGVQQLVIQGLGSELMDTPDHGLPCLQKALQVAGWVPDPQLAEPSSDSLDTDDEDPGVLHAGDSLHPRADVSNSPDPRVVDSVPIYDDTADYQKWIATELCDPIGNRHFTTAQKLIAIICEDFKVGTVDSQLNTERYQNLVVQKEEQLEQQKEELTTEHKLELLAQKRFFHEKASNTLACFYDNMTSWTTTFEDEACARIAFNRWLNTIIRSKNERETQFLRNTVSEMGAELKVTVPALDAASKELSVLREEKADWDSKFERLDGHKKQLQDRVTMLTDDRKEHDDEIRRRFHKLQFANEVLSGKNEILESEKENHLQRLSRMHRQRDIFFARFYARMPQRRMTFFSPQTSIPGMEDLVRERVFHGWAFLAMKDRIVKFDKLRNTAQELREEIRRRNATMLGSPNVQTGTVSPPPSNFHEKAEGKGRHRLGFETSPELQEGQPLAFQEDDHEAIQMSKRKAISGRKTRSKERGQLSLSGTGDRSLSPSSPRRQLPSGKGSSKSQLQADRSLNPQVVSAAVDVLQQQVRQLRSQLDERDQQLKSVKGELSEAKNNYEELLGYSEGWYSELEALKSRPPKESSLHAASALKEAATHREHKSDSAVQRTPRGVTTREPTSLDSQADPIDPERTTTSSTLQLHVSQELASPHESASPPRRVSL